MGKSKRIAWATSTLALALLGFVGTHKILAARAVDASGLETEIVEKEIEIDDFSFAPTSLTVTAGTPITWINHDDIPHTVIEDEKTFKSKVLDTGEKFTFTPTNPGTYNYYCSLHPKMTAVLVVK